MSSKKLCDIQYNFLDFDRKQVLIKMGKEKLKQALSEMLLIRNFDQRGEQAYQMGKVGGFFHSYQGQEAIQTGAMYAVERANHYWITTYRCHGLALLMGMSAKAGMCELYGKANGCAGGHGGSMHFYYDNMFGGDGIVGGAWPTGAGLAFSLKYRGIKDKIAFTFGGDGAVVQGTFHETMNLAKLWKLPVIFVIENNQLGMGTQIHRAISFLPIGETIARGYNIKSFTFNGMDFLASYYAFQKAFNYVTEYQEPVIMEAIAERFRGHSISDAAHYRTKEDLSKIIERDPIKLLSKDMIEAHMITEEEIQAINQMREKEVIEAMDFADKSPFPPLSSLGEGVMKGV